MPLLPRASVLRGVGGQTKNAKETETLKAEPIVLVHDIRMAFAEDKAIPPPGW